MEHYRWKSLLLFAVLLHSAAPFKIPGLSSGSRTPPATNKAAGGGGGHKASDGGGEYVGPVFIIRELNKEAGEYDAFITTGGIQEVKPPHPGHQHPGQQHPGQQHPGQQQQYHANPQHPNAQHPSLLQQQQQQQQQQQEQQPAAKEVEDSEYFGVLVTAETVKTLNHPKSASINVSVSVLLTASSSRMPWLLVLHRKDYPHLFEYQQQQPPRPLEQFGTPPGMQLPQRRRYYSDRQRRGLYPTWTDNRGYRDVDGGEEPLDRAPAAPVLFERELLSTICYNFARDTDVVAEWHAPDDRAAAAAAAATATASAPYFDANAYAKAAAQPAVPENLPMDVPKRVS